MMDSQSDTQCTIVGAERKMVHKGTPGVPKRLAKPRFSTDYQSASTVTSASVIECGGQVLAG
jgi:hypothetical protein